MNDYDLLSMSDGMQVFMFRLEDVPYGVRIEHLLAISQDTRSLRQVPSQAPGFVGLIEYLGTVVPVLDLARMLGRKSRREMNEELISLLNAREKDHLEWLGALERSITNDLPFTGERDPHRCAFGRWYDSYQPEPDLAELFKDFDAPHQRIHALADELLEKARKDGKEAALKMLVVERQTTLAGLQRTFDFVRETLRSNLHEVLMYVTLDGRTPRMALRVDDIRNILAFEQSDRIPLDAIELPTRAIPRELISDYLRGKVGDCFLLDPRGLIHAAETGRQQAA